MATTHANFCYGLDSNYNLAQLCGWLLCIVRSTPTKAAARWQFPSGIANLAQVSSCKDEFLRGPITTTKYRRKEGWVGWLELSNSLVSCRGESIIVIDVSFLNILITLVVSGAVR